MKFKRLLALSLAICLVTGTCSSAFAMNIRNDTVLEAIHQETIKSRTGEYAEDITKKTLLDLAGNTFELVETGDIGYYIFDVVSGKYLEEAPESPSPYLGLYDNLYYFGPLCYYQKIGETFHHTVLSDEYNLSAEEMSTVQPSFSEGLTRSRAVKNEVVLSLLNQRTTNLEVVSTLSTQAIDDDYITREDYIRYAIYPENENGTCGYTAACLVLNYWHQLKGGIIPREYLDEGGNLRTDANNLQDKLLSYGYATGTWGKDIRDVLIDFCNEYGIKATSTYYLLDFDVPAELSRNRPVILFGYYPKSPTPYSINGLGFHAVTAYGRSASGDIIVHYGWRGYEHVLLDPLLTGSSTQFVLN